jgi:hypothetical protein
MLCMHAGCFLLALPETIGLPLPETIANDVSGSHYGGSAATELQIFTSEDGLATSDLRAGKCIHTCRHAG